MQDMLCNSLLVKPLSRRLLSKLMTKLQSVSLYCGKYQLRGYVTIN